MLNTIIQKNETFSKYYILEDFLLFKIKSIKTTTKEQFVFFDYTYKNTKLYSFISFNEAEQELYKRFEDYKTKFNIKDKKKSLL
jgi:flagella basal body P-ring formation protein FlgA